MINLLLLPAALIFPNWMLLTLYIPVLMILSYAEVIPDLFSIGDADVKIHDLVILVVIFKFVSSFLLKKMSIDIYDVYRDLALFILVMFGATVIANYRFGEQIFWAELVSLLRLTVQTSIVFLLACSINTQKQLGFAQKIINYLGYVIAITVYLNIVAVLMGFQFGEVRPNEEMVRYFGPIGDQVGFILIFFVYKQLLSGNILGAMFLGGAVIATGTVGAIGTFLVGLIVISIYTHKNTSRGKITALAAGVSLLVFFGVLFWADVGSIQTRIVQGNAFGFSGVQRILTAQLALETFRDNLLTGVGYMGFRYYALELNAEQLFQREFFAYSPVYTATASNQLLQVATDGGIAALIAFGWLILTCLRTLKSAIGYTSDELQVLLRAGYTWLLALLIGAQTAAWLLPGSLISYLLWLILGTSLAARKIRKMALSS